MGCLYLGRAYDTPRECKYWIIPGTGHATRHGKFLIMADWLNSEEACGKYAEHYQGPGWWYCFTDPDTAYLFKVLFKGKGRASVVC